ncbi:MAG: hypothetical protein UZ07_CHB004002350 [Chlorobi bacterium OLB7]|nr:MAG: hypothetical protein UZ07_CHB004002350 [Chlorobi bacterium OLB7]
MISPPGTSFDSSIWSSARLTRSCRATASQSMGDAAAGVVVAAAPFVAFAFGLPLAAWVVGVVVERFAIVVVMLQEWID